jgi:hypothetical protein
MMNRMAQESSPRPLEDKSKLRQYLPWFTLLPLPVCVFMEVLIGSAFWIIPNSGNAPGWILNVLETVCCGPYLGAILLAIVAEILFLTALKTWRTGWMKIMMWINPILIGIHILLIAWIFLELTYANPFTF